LTVVAPDGVSELGVTAQLPAEGAPLQLSETSWWSPSRGSTVTVYVTVWPADMLADVELAVSEKSWPVPDNDTDCGLADALSVKVRVPVREPAAPGLKVTVMVQLAPAARLAGQALVWEKSPVAAMFVTLSVALPPFVTLIVCAVLAAPRSSPPKFKLAGETLASAPTPFPAKEILCEPGTALSLRSSAPVRLPGAVGLNITVTVQAAPGLKELPQASAAEKSPLALMLVRVRLAVPELVIVTA
jgi:hypothetical protein